MTKNSPSGDFTFLSLYQLNQCVLFTLLWEKRNKSYFCPLNVMRRCWTVLSEKDKGPISVHFRAMRHSWQVSHGLSGD